MIKGAVAVWSEYQFAVSLGAHKRIDKTADCLILTKPVLDQNQRSETLSNITLMVLKLLSPWPLEENIILFLG